MQIITMTTGFHILTLLSVYHVAQSYILLTADLEDVHTIAKQIASSPVAGQLNKIIRRASSLFSQQADSRVQKRTDYSDGEDTGHHNAAESVEEYHSEVADRRRNTEEVVALGKNATHYLQSIKKIFENV
ncbi:uncharacterized protein LOC115442464 [Manduca sexta]|uniref:Uncharacterized protein n=1 Tax=Manduca sexta TaxID=7130 RepID=A0A921YZ09_MANSE|nr:uncharacterized protein LOC115442464 [Manduca sexta]KAG6448501.1 hypothetical protein O3G_MSEX005512 [Manduca sexta]